jgi:toxin ParE1/3/4
VKVKPLVPRERANQDVDDAIAYYLEEASSAVALGFVDELERSYIHIARYPGTGLPRYGHELDLPGLRAWALSSYPYLVFYVEPGPTTLKWRSAATS